MQAPTAAANAATKIRIVSRWNSETVLFECDAPEGLESGLYMRHALEKATEARRDLRGANLRGANLSDANLSGAYLRDAYLRDANLRGAYLSGAYLSDANLRGANLSGANLSDANLRGANLSDANLSDAYLSGAYLSGAYLSGAYLSGFRTDFWDVLLRAPHEIAGVRAALIEGRVDGSTYSGECACLVGTIANIRHTSYSDLGNDLNPDSGRPAEQWFMGIRKGDTPETNQQSKLAVEWLDELVGLLAVAKTVAWHVRRSHPALRPRLPAYAGPGPEAGADRQHVGRWWLRAPAAHVRGPSPSLARAGREHGGWCCERRPDCRGCQASRPLRARRLDAGPAERADRRLRPEVGMSTAQHTPGLMEAARATLKAFGKAMSSYPIGSDKRNALCMLRDARDDATEAMKAAEKILDSVAFVSVEGDTDEPLRLLRAAIAKATGSAA